MSPASPTKCVEMCKKGSPCWQVSNVGAPRQFGACHWAWPRGQSLHSLHSLHRTHHLESWMIYEAQRIHMASSLSLFGPSWKSNVAICSTSFGFPTCGRYGVEQIVPTWPDVLTRCNSSRSDLLSLLNLHQSTVSPDLCETSFSRCQDASISCGPSTFYGAYRSNGSQRWL